MLSASVRAFCIVFSVGFLLAASPADSSAADRKSSLPQPDETVDYKTTPQGKLQLHIFKPKTESSSPRPAIVFFFGGGWVSGSPSQFYPHCRHLADRGMVAIAAEYRIKNKHETTPFECVEDGNSAIRWVREHAADYQIDPKRVAAGGGSAGGHVAASTATLQGFDAASENKSISSQPDALVLFNPVVDTTAKGWAAGARKLGDRAEELSPLQHIHEDTPAAIIFHGTGDTTVPFENVERFCEAMKKAGHRCELHGYADRPHGFFNYGRNKEDYQDTVEKMDDFLVSLGWLQKP